MPGLAELTLKRAYRKREDDIAAEFYLPSFGASKRYDRAVGYFSSSVYLLAWTSLKAFVRNGGKMRLICSPVLSDADHEAMREGYSDRATEAFGSRLKAGFADLMASAVLRKPTIVLASLIAADVIDCKVAWVDENGGGSSKRLFHDKLGIFTDEYGQRIVFKGSMNETWPGLSLDGNIESVDVFASWRDDGERERISEETRYFERVWDDMWPGVVTRPFPESARAEIISAADAAHWPEFVDEICMQLERAAHWSPEPGRQTGRTPRPHQVSALEAWRAHGRRGIFEHATGSGKTYSALCAMNDAFGQGEVPLVLVPSELLLQQWEVQIKSTFPDVQLLACGAGHSDWGEDARLRKWTRPTQPGHRPKAVLSTLQTASSPTFMGLCSTGSHLFMVADEVHRMGAPEARRLLALETGARLGLSATPRRAGDPEGTEAIIAYFERIIEPPFTLADAIRSGALVPYAYSPHPIRLDPEEQSRWLEIGNELRKLVARMHGNANADLRAKDRLKLLLIKRARLVKNARAKVRAAVEILQREFVEGQHWIVYCDDQTQLGDVITALRSLRFPDLYEYHSAMAGDRVRTLDLFTRRGGIVVSIRCLDEGIDIPAVSHALILASSRNPREFIQRRGRVLRRSDGKSLAHIHDIIVTPARREDGEDFGSMLSGELARAIEFGSNAANPGCIAELKRIAAEFGVALEAAASGFETDDDADGDAERETTNA